MEDGSGRWNDFGVWFWNLEKNDEKKKWGRGQLGEKETKIGILEEEDMRWRREQREEKMVSQKEKMVKGRSFIREKSKKLREKIEGCVENFPPVSLKREKEKKKKLSLLNFFSLNINQ